MKKIRADRVWAQRDRGGRSITGHGTKIAVLDTGVNSNHPDLDEGKVIGEHCFLNSTTDPCLNGRSQMHGPGAAHDENGHGTHVASIAAGSGEASGGLFKGVAPNAEIIAIKVLGKTGGGLVSDIILGLEKAVEYRPDVINLSLGTLAEWLSDCYEDLLSQVVDRIVDSGIPVVAAAGNDGKADKPNIGSPGCAINAITVGASDIQDRVADLSSSGPAFGRSVKPDVVAPGEDICAAKSTSANIYNSEHCSWDGLYAYMSGTSMATPHVAGLVALLKQKLPSLRPAEIKQILWRNTVNLGTSWLEQGYGRVDALKSAADHKPPVVFMQTWGIVSGLVKIRFTPVRKEIYRVSYGHNTMELGVSGVPICKIDTRTKRGARKQCLWNTGRLRDGLYNLRVTFTDTAKQSTQDNSLVLVRNAPNSDMICNSCLSCTLYSAWSSNRVKLGNDLIHQAGTCIRVIGKGVNFDCDQKRLTGLPTRSDPQIGISANTKDPTIRNCTFSRLQYPLVLRYPGQNITVSSNIISNPRYGITISEVRHATLRQNAVVVDANFQDFQQAFDVWGTLHSLNHAIDTSNTISGKPFYYLFNQYNRVLSGIEVGGLLLIGALIIS